MQATEPSPEAHAHIDETRQAQYIGCMNGSQGLDIAMRTFGCAALGIAFVYFGWTLCAGVCSNLKTSTRWSLTLLGALISATLIFHLLAMSGHFRLGPALFVTFLLAVPMHCGVTPFNEFVGQLLRDARYATLALSRTSAGVRIMLGVFGALLCVPVGLSLIIPPLGWDAVSYHMAKAAMWVQNGRLETLRGPGGWSYFPLFPGGGDLVYAWAMLPFHSDLIACLCGTLFGLSVGLVTYALARALEVSRLGSGVSALWVLFTPAVHRMLGSGYVEPILQLATSLMALCAVLFFRKDEPRLLAFSVAACGLMAGIKVMGLVLGAAGAFFVIIYAAWRHRANPTYWGAVVLGLGAAAAVVLPWWGMAWAETGRPLSPLPLRMFGISLGVINPDLQWLQIRESASFSLRREWDTLRSLFVWDAGTPRLGLSWAVGFMLWPLGLWKLSRARQGTVAAFFLALIGAFAAAYYQPEMLVLRTHWATTNARYWIQLLPLVAVLCAYGVEKSLRWGRIAWAVVVIFVTVAHARIESFWGIGPSVLGVIPVIAGTLFVVGLIVLWCVARGHMRMLLGISIVTGPVALAVVGSYRDAERWRIYADGGTMRLHALLRYWVPAAESLDNPQASRRIAVTSAPWQNGDNWLVYPFLGRRFQNVLVYVPISRDGRMVPFDGSARYLETSDPAAWSARLYQNKIGFVMTFWPPSVERYWMLQNRDFFEPVWVGRKWGCFALRPWREAVKRLQKIDAN